MKRIIRPISGNATDIGLDTGSFTKNLGPTENTVQKALNKLDQLTASGGSSTATAVTVSTTNFSKNLTAAEDTVQKALDKIDDLVIVSAASDVTVTTTNFNGRLSGTENTVQKALDKLDDINAASIPVDTTGYTGNLGSTHNTVQKIADAVNSLSVNGISDWNTGILYKVGANVTFLGVAFRCTSEHTSTATFDLTKWSVSSPFAVLGSISGGATRFQCIYYDGGTWESGSPVSNVTLPTHVVIYASGTSFIAVTGGRYTVTAHGNPVGYYYAAAGGGSSTTKGTPYEAPVFDVIDADTFMVLTDVPAVKYASAVTSIAYGREFSYSFTNNSMSVPLKYEVYLPQDIDYAFIDMDVSIRLNVAAVVSSSAYFVNATPTGVAMNTYPGIIFFNDIESSSYAYQTVSAVATTVSGGSGTITGIPLYSFQNSVSGNSTGGYYVMRGCVNNGGYPEMQLTHSRGAGTGSTVSISSQSLLLAQAVKVTKVTLMIAANMTGQMRIKLT